MGVHITAIKKENHYQCDHNGASGFCDEISG